MTLASLAFVTIPKHTHMHTHTLTRTHTHSDTGMHRPPSSEPHSRLFTPRLSTLRTYLTEGIHMTVLLLVLDTAFVSRRPIVLSSYLPIG